MKSLIVLLISLSLIAGPTNSQAQEVQWASGIAGFSSYLKWEKNTRAYQPQEALGAPSLLPGTVNTSESGWAAALENNGEEWLAMTFQKPTPIQQVIICQNNSPGGIVKVTVYGRQDSLVVANEPNGLKQADYSLPLYLTFPRTPFAVEKVRIWLNTKLVAGFEQIDAVGIADHTKPVPVAIRLVNGADAVLNKERLGTAINSAFDELNPKISPDGKQLYFTREAHPENIGIAQVSNNQDIWVANLDGSGNFQPAINMNTPLNNKDNNGLMSITPDGQKVLLMNVYNPDGSMGVGISTAVKSGDTWQQPQQVVIEDFYNRSNFGEYFLDVSGKILLMTVDREDTYGNKDVYVSFAKEDGTWSKPLNLGATINTAGSEVSPFLAADGVTLYYSTGGKPGYGSRDIFLARRLDDTWTNWTEPENLGPSINTTGFDAYYTLPASGDYAYFSSVTTDQKSDIFRLALPTSAKPKPVALIKGKVLNPSTKAPIGADILYENLSTGEKLGKALSNSKDGYYSIILPGGNAYGFLAQAAGFVSVNENLDLTKLDRYQEIEQDLYLAPLEKGQIIRLNNVFFDTDKYSFRKETFLELDRLVSLLEAQPTLKIEIAGHTDSQGQDAYNLTLSGNRAKAVYDYLISKKVDKTRLLFKGYGETKPVGDNNTEKGRQLNRRVECRILEI